MDLPVPGLGRAPHDPDQEHPLKAEPTLQLQLLDVQAIDAQDAQLRHQRDHLPELAELAELAASRTELDNQRRDLQIEVDDLGAEQAKVDTDVESVKARRARDQDRMDKGQVGAKDLARLQDEMTSLQRRITSLEDDELEVMQKLEEAQAILDAVLGQLALADARIAELRASRDERATHIDAELARLAGERGPAVEGMPEDLMKLYDRVRQHKGGVGAAELRQRRCTGCQLNIDNAELAVIAATPADTVVRCEECTRILVRTPESGL